MPQFKDTFPNASRVANAEDMETMLDWYGDLPVWRNFVIGRDDDWEARKAKGIPAEMLCYEVLCAIGCRHVSLVRGKKDQQTIGDMRVVFPGSNVIESVDAKSTAELYVSSLMQLDDGVVVIANMRCDNYQFAYRITPESRAYLLGRPRLDGPDGKSIFVNMKQLIADVADCVVDIPGMRSEFPKALGRAVRDLGMVYRLESESRTSLQGRQSHPADIMEVINKTIKKQ